MTAPVGKAPSKTEKAVAEPPKKLEDKFDPSAYSCEIIQEKTTFDKSNECQINTK